MYLTLIRLNLLLDTPLIFSSETADILDIFMCTERLIYSCIFFFLPPAEKVAVWWFWSKKKSWEISEALLRM